ncbi:centriolar and ciliogenesis-associated protein HYLS1-like [Liolophura sinensis]|uniref:centriolar and ciliogenesis-associated protein HYLS1-like n=1 Tax=Liolophura sinensis TaxID=3198878 RepID=UPI0031589135
MDDDLDFTDEEIREELSKLGYYDIAPSRLQQFKTDLERLVRFDRSKNSSQEGSLLSPEQFRGDESFRSQPYIHKERIPLEGTAFPDRNRTKASVPSYLHDVHGKENLCSDQEDGERLISYSNRVGAHGDPSGSRFIKIPQINDNLSETDSERRYMRRKILRKGSDGSKIIDESVTESEVGSLADIEERLKEVRLSYYTLNHRGERTRPASAPPAQAPYRLDPDDPRPASVILRSADHPHTRNLRKCDPVARGQQFRQSWAANRVPGEKAHKRLRWNVREQMLCRDTMEYKRPQKTYVPNSYVVPTEKKRSALRWQVRMDIAQGNVPLTDLPEDF